ncbi:MarR family winged helix-turn-helix transcriptional regulator [Paenibacillus gansuensis]|uniref:MarR family winged helix-turn-helix transcriptional regulator n=1 Tax=Paenibacillus gansuensis TaxID=306542 RepID=A0ABW5PIU6_9BACL
MDSKLLSQLIDRYFSSMNTVQRAMNVMITERMPKHLTSDQFCILKYIGEQEQCTSSELSEVFFVGKSSITAMINRLAEKELIVRHPDEKDRRVTYLALTEEGKRLSQELNRTIEQLLAKYIVHFEEEEALAFINTLEKLGKVLSEQEGGRE